MHGYALGHLVVFDGRRGHIEDGLTALRGQPLRETALPRAHAAKNQYPTKATQSSVLVTR
jgi:hypothetical protein